MVVKDLDGMTAGDPYHLGTRHLGELAFVGDHDSYLHAKFKEAGLVIIGRTNTPELGLVPTTEPEHRGPSRNPWDTGRSTGGSSGGSAAAVASLMVPIGHAGDGGGSIRSLRACGLVGSCQPGLHSLGPGQRRGWSRAPPVTAVRDTAVASTCRRRAMPGDPYTAAPDPALPRRGGRSGRAARGAGPGDPGIVTHPDCVAATEHAAGLLAGLGHQVAPAEHELFADIDYQAMFTTHFINAFGVWTAAELDEISRLSGVPVTQEGVEPGTWATAELGRSVTGVQFQEAIEFMHGFTRRMAAWWADGHDLLLTPTITEPPPELGQFGATPDNPLNGLFRSAPIVQFTAPFNATGQPAISLPLTGTRTACPSGCSSGRAWRDLLLRAVAQLEAAQPWADRLPPVHA
jgi:amidase